MHFTQSRSPQILRKAADQQQWETLDSKINLLILERTKNLIFHRLSDDYRPLARDVTRDDFVI